MFKAEPPLDIHVRRLVAFPRFPAAVLAGRELLPEVCLKENAMPLSRRSFLAYSGAAAGLHAMPAFAVQTGSRENGSLPRLPDANFLEAADLTALDGDEQTLLATLEGQVNRTEPRIYLYWGTDQTNAKWLNTIRTPHRVLTNPWELLDRYRSEVRGAVLYDVNVPDSVNVATAIASLRGGVIATPALAKAHQLEVLDDLTGRFTDTVSAYEYALAHVWPHLSDRILTAISPTNTIQVANVPWTVVLTEPRPITDASNKATYTIDLSKYLGGGAVYVRFRDNIPTDGYGPAVQQVTVTADGATVASFAPGTTAEGPFLFDADGSQLASGGWRFADGYNYFTYAFTPPADTKQLMMQVLMWNEFAVDATATAPSVQQGNAVFRDYIVATQAPVFWLDPEIADQAALFETIAQRAKPNTPYLGWFPLGHEMPGVTLLSRYASPVVAADNLFNGSVFAGVREKVEAKVPAPPPVPKLENKIYLTLTMVEGDNVQYCQHRLRDLWDDPGRGSVLLNWSISVLLLDIAPGFLNYYQTTRTENDLLLAGPSGAGYTYPAEWPAQAFEVFTKHTGEYMQRTGMNTLFVYNRSDTTNLPLTPELVAPYQRNIPGLLGIVLNYDPTSVVSVVNGLPVVTLLGVNDIAGGQAQLAKIAAGWDGNSPLFVAAGIESYTAELTPTGVTQITDTLGSEFEIVRGDTFFQMLSRMQKHR